uniref:MHC class I-like antigen recognition-like domain-containing protein n=1 Tax=Oryzias sinensis TaxID=183150 RepID=A0A8C7X3F3_9TELE
HFPRTLQRSGCVFFPTVTHSLRYLHSASSGIPGFPGFVTVVLVDGQPFSYYDSVVRRELPRQSWMVQTEDPDFWESPVRGVPIAHQ